MPLSRILLIFAVGLFLTYPAAVLTTIIEGQSAAAIYSFHLFHSLFSYLLVSLPLIFMLRNKLPKLKIPKVQKSHVLLLGIVLLYSILVFKDIGRADILNDDYDLAYQAYNLQDGILAARKAFVISFNTHPPLFMTIKHYWFQLLFPNGLETVPSWGYRGMEGVMGIATILAAYLLTKNLWAPAILSVNNYMVFLGRVYLREMYLVFFLTLALYFFRRKRFLIFAFLFGCAMLIKTSAIILFPLFLTAGLRPFLLSLLIYSPVLAYNLGSYLTTGHMDATFSKIFGLPHPFLTQSESPFVNLVAIKDYLVDIYSFPVLLFFSASVTICFLQRRHKLLLLVLASSVLYFVFSGPIREYYLLFLTVPFAILAADVFSRHRILLLAFLIYSFWYSVSGDSNSRRIYESVRGWPELIRQISARYQSGDCLEATGGVNDLAMRAYFQTDDGVKKALLGPTYPHHYKMCDEVTSPSKKIQIFYNSASMADYQIL